MVQCLRVRAIQQGMPEHDAQDRQLGPAHGRREFRARADDTCARSGDGLCGDRPRSIQEIGGRYRRGRGGPRTRGQEGRQDTAEHHACGPEHVAPHFQWVESKTQGRGPGLGVITLAIAICASRTDDLTCRTPRAKARGAASYCAETIQYIPPTCWGVVGLCVVTAGTSPLRQNRKAMKPGHDLAVAELLPSCRRAAGSVDHCGAETPCRCRGPHGPGCCSPAPGVAPACWDSPSRR